MKSFDSQGSSLSEQAKTANDTEKKFAEVNKVPPLDVGEVAYSASRSKSAVHQNKVNSDFLSFQKNAEKELSTSEKELSTINVSLQRLEEKNLQKSKRLISTRAELVERKGNISKQMRVRNSLVDRGMTMRSETTVRNSKVMSSMLDSRLSTLVSSFLDASLLNRKELREDFVVDSVLVVNGKHTCRFNLHKEFYFRDLLDEATKYWFVPGEGSSSFSLLDANGALVPLNTHVFKYFMKYQIDAVCFLVHDCNPSIAELGSFDLPSYFSDLAAKADYEKRRQRRGTSTTMEVFQEHIFSRLPAFLTFIIALLLIISTALSTGISAGYQLNLAFKGHIEEIEVDGYKLKNINRVEEVWDFMGKHLPTFLFLASDDSSGYFGRQNEILKYVVFQQIRVTDGSGSCCRKAAYMEEAKTNCYCQYGSGARSSSQTFGLRIEGDASGDMASRGCMKVANGEKYSAAESELMGFVQCVEGSSSAECTGVPLPGCYFKHKMKDDITTKYSGQLASSYPKSGYFTKVQVTGRFDTFREAVATLKSRKWIDEQTTMISISANFINNTNKMATSMVIMFEIATSGAVIPSLKVLYSPLSDSPVASNYKISAYLDLATFLLSLYLFPRTWLHHLKAYRRISKLKLDVKKSLNSVESSNLELHKHRFWVQGQTWAQICLLITLALCLSRRFSVMTSMLSFVDVKQQSATGFVDLYQTGWDFKMANILEAVATIFAWIATVKALILIPSLRVIIGASKLSDYQVAKVTFSLKRFIRDLRVSRQLKGAVDLTEAMYRKPEFIVKARPNVGMADEEKESSGDEDETFY
eukprot:g4052.t1